MAKKEDQTVEITEEKKEELKAELRSKVEEIREKGRIANEAMAEGKGRLELEKPLRGAGKDITELAYDFNELTGLEYTDAMDSDPAAQQIYRITYKQALALFARAAAKQTEGLDSRDIMEQLGMTDATTGIQLATLFFSASTRSGRLRISKK